jgi:hypothetical protein
MYILSRKSIMSLDSLKTRMSQVLATKWTSLFWQRKNLIGIRRCQEHKNKEA